MKIIFLMGGRSLLKEEDQYPPYMTERNGQLVLETQIANVEKLNPDKYIFCIKQEDSIQFHLPNLLNQLVKNPAILTIQRQTAGAVCSALLAIDQINDAEEVLIMAVDDFLDTDAAQIIQFFHTHNSDAGIVTFESVHPRYSFARLDNDGRVVEVAEKQPISKNALASFYYFRHGCDYVECAKEVIRKDNPVNGAFYISQVINEMILKQKNISMYKIPSSEFHPLKSEIQLNEFLYGK